MLLGLLIGFSAMAADKSGVSPNVISLPKGPGSIEGLGESFQPTLNTGTAKYGLGLKLPTGTAGHHPSLALSYDGGGANGPLGYGWTLSLPWIQRRTDKGIPTYGQDFGVARIDTFINENREELVPQPDGYFFCKNEGAFVRYRAVADHWEATTPDGTRLEFGITSAGRIEDAATGHVFSWLLERETDTRGNVIEYHYASFPGAQNLNQKYLALVRYGPGTPPWTHFHFAALEYEDRPDWFEDARAGFLVRTGKRLTSVIIGTQTTLLDGHLAGDFDGDGLTDYLNRRYNLTYLDYAGTNSHWSLLETVTLVGADGLTALPPARFAYGVSDPLDELSARDHLWVGLDEPPVVMDNDRVDLIDLNADGLPDLLRTESGGVHTAFVNQGPSAHYNPPAIAWGPPVAVNPGNGTAWNFDLASDRTHLADMNGDGLADLVHQAADDSVFFFANSGRLQWGERQDMAVPGIAPPAPFGVSDVRTADMDFDKHIDIVQSIDVGAGIAYRIWFNLGNQAYSTPFTIEPQTGFDFALAGVHIADCNGDRVPDVARIRSGEVTVAAGLGYGRFAEPQSMLLPDATLDDLQISKARLIDINGDGLADLVLERAEPGVCWYWLNLGNYTFSNRKSIVDLPAVFSAHTTVRWADLNGNGTTDLIYADSEATPRLQMIELGQLVSGGLAPNLITRIENGIGRVTAIEYAPSTRFALEDAAAGNPWPDPLPFPVTVVAGMTVSDSLGHEYRTEFRYHDGYYDPVEKQFRGFARVEQVDVGDPSAPTLVTRSHFDTGRDFEAMKGKLLRLTAEQIDGQVFWDEMTTWADPPRTLMIGTNGVEVQFAHPVGMTKDLIELGQGESRRLEIESEYDDFGNQTREANYGIVEGTHRDAFNDQRITTAEFAINTNAWILRLPMRQEIADENGAVISRTESFYDDETFSGNNLGIVTIGNLTLQRAWIAPSNATAFIQAVRTRYDTYGNAIALFDPISDGTEDIQRGHFRTLTYDDDFHSYPMRESIHVGKGKPALTIQASYDLGLGTVMSSTDFNGQLTRYSYDALGRLIHLLKPGDTPGYPSAEYTYALAVPVGATSVVNYVETRLRDRSEILDLKSEMYLVTRQFTDGLGRALMSRSEAEPAPGSSTPRVVVGGAVQFNAREKPVRVLSPFFTTRTGSLEELLDFEDIEAPDWRGQFHEAGALVNLDLASAHATTTEYDAALRAIRTINPDGTASRTTYEPLINRIFDENDTDPSSPHFNTPMVQFSDGLGRLIRVDELVRHNDDGTDSHVVNTWTTRYEYDLNDALTRITDSQNNVKLMGYDALTRKLFMNDPDVGISTHTYDDASNLIETVDAKGQRVSYTYDGANRLLTEDYHDEASPEFSYHRSPDVTYFYDQPAHSVDLGDGTRSTAQFTKGRLAYVDDATGQEHTSFDSRGRIQWTVKRVLDPQLSSLPSTGPGEAQLVSYKTEFRYDAMDRVTRLIYPDNDEVGYEYNERGLMRRIEGGPNGNILSRFVYAPSAQQVQLDFGNGVRTSYHYDNRQRLTSLITRHASSGIDLIGFAYTFDGISNIKTIEDKRPASLIPASDPRRNSQVFAYDDLYRLTQVQYNLPNLPSANGGEISYRYDRIGNMISQVSDIAHVEKGHSVTDPGVMTYGGIAGPANRVGRAANDPPGPHALTQIRNERSEIRDLHYDANGNTTDVDGLRCTWDFKDRLVAVEDETMRAEYRYDYTDRRVIKKVSSKPGANAPAATLSPPSVVTYPGKHFEVREHDEPNKYVFNGASRLAHVTGSLSTNDRVQRLRLYAGWNLCSLAVTGSGLANDAITAAYRWNQPDYNWLPVSTDETLEAGTVLWLLATTNTTLALTGTYSNPTDQSVAVGGSFVPSAGLESRKRAGMDTELAWSLFDALNGLWQIHKPSIPILDPGLPEAIAPGQAIFIDSEAPLELEVPNPSLRVRYYHQDHLGSASVMTDTDGALVEETAFYPFGNERHTHRLHEVEEQYKFTEKERDRESGLHYFEARYLASTLSRFITPDPKYASPGDLSSSDMATFLAQPQALNLYAYAFNNPVRYDDPTGLDANDKVSLSVDAAGAVAAATEEAALWNYRFNPKAASSTGGTVVKVAGKTAAVVSVTWKAAEFINDPSEATGAQLANEGGKALMGVAAPPVGLIWAVLDLTGYGPSQMFDALDKATQASNQAAAAHRQTAAIHRATANMINEAVPRIAAKQQHARERLKVLKQETAKLNRTNQKVLKGDTRSLAELNAAIQRQERINRRTEAQARHWEAKARKAQQ